MNESEPANRDQVLVEKMVSLYERLLDVAVRQNENGTPFPDIPSHIVQLGKKKHAARGVLLTCAAYKHVCPGQDIRLIKVKDFDSDEGYSFRKFDEEATVPFLAGHRLSHNVQGHMQTASVSFTDYKDNKAPKTSPRWIGEYLVEGMIYLQEAGDTAWASEKLILALLRLLAEERERDESQRVVCPAKLPISGIMGILRRHIMQDYGKNSARLPQLAVYAMYECIVGTLPRYDGCVLQELEAQKAADRKTGSSGDIDVLGPEGRPFEAVEVKHRRAIKDTDVMEAMEKISFHPMDRYLMLTTEEKESPDLDSMAGMIRQARAVYGCEIIVNGVFDTIKYYLRLLPSPDAFVENYVSLLKNDAEVTYAMRESWNRICAAGQP